MRIFAQGMHDWGMWFSTLLMIAVVAALIGLAIADVRRFKRQQVRMAIATLQLTG